MPALRSTKKRLAERFCQPFFCALHTGLTGVFKQLKPGKQYSNRGPEYLGPGSPWNASGWQLGRSSMSYGKINCAAPSHTRSVRRDKDGPCSPSLSAAHIVLLKKTISPYYWTFLI
jgi:hypothetical protein